MKLDTLITQFTDDLDFDALESWCEILDVSYDPDNGDMENFLKWEIDLRDKIAEAMLKVGEKE